MRVTERDLGDIQRHRRSTTAIWAVLTLLTVLALAAVPLTQNSRYYFYGDTQVGSFGQWYHFGELLRAGHWPLIDLTTWRAGNFVAEGQWGLFSPLVMVIALASTVAPNAVVLASAVKILTLLTAALGTFLLARTYRLHPAAAYVAGLAVTGGGVTQYLDSPSWMTGLLVWALLPWAWWGIRRTMLDRRNPFPALLAGYLVVTVGYVYGTLLLAVVVAVSLVDCVLARDRTAFLKVLGIGVCGGLVAVTIYLPGILTASVTTRDTWEILNDGQLTIDVRALLVSVLPTGVVNNILGEASPLPVGYIAWFVPLLAWVDPRRLRGRVRPLVGVIVMTTVTTLFALGPSDVGPLRWPVRVMPFVVLGVVLIVVALVSQGLRRPSPGRVLLSLAWVGVAFYLSVTRALEDVRAAQAGAALVGLGIVLVWLVLLVLGSRRAHGTLAGRSLATVLALVIGGWSVGLTYAQHRFYPNPPSKNRNMPTDVADYALPLRQAQGDVMMLGHQIDTVIADPSAARELLIGSSWLVNPHPVQSTYTTIGFTAYNQRYCINFIGETCWRALRELTSVEATTGEQRVDLLSVNTLLVVRSSLPNASAADPPEGWRVAESTDLAVTWVRTVPVPTAGGVVATSDGTAVEQLSSDARTVRFRVTSTGALGGRVTFSRLAWPGYTATGASLAPPVDGYLLAVRVPAGSDGQVVTVHFDPPGWRAEVAAWWVSVGLGVLWSLGMLVVQVRRRMRGRAVAAASTEDAAEDVRGRAGDGSGPGRGDRQRVSRRGARQRVSRRGPPRALTVPGR